MSVSFAIAIYVIIWWTVLFAVLPIGVRTQEEDGTIVPGTPASAPTRPRLLRIVVLTTFISALVFAALWFAVRSGLIDLERWLGRPSMSDLAAPDTISAQMKRARPWALLEGLPMPFLSYHGRSSTARRAQNLPQTWAPKPLHNARSCDRFL